MNGRVRRTFHRTAVLTLTDMGCWFICIPENSVDVQKLRATLLHAPPRAVSCANGAPKPSSLGSERVEARQGVDKSCRVEDIIGNCPESFRRAKGINPDENSQLLLRLEPTAVPDAKNRPFVSATQVPVSSRHVKSDTALKCSLSDAAKCSPIQGCRCLFLAKACKETCWHNPNQTRPCELRLINRFSYCRSTGESRDTCAA